MSVGVDAAREQRAARRDRWTLAGALLALGALYLAWFREDRHAVAAWIVFAGPPLLLGLWTAYGGSARSRFLAGVFGLFWFSHGVMTAWADAAHRGYALCGIAFAVLAIFAANAAGLRARLGKSRR